jgi:hypothetical protein
LFRLSQRVKKLVIVYPCPTDERLGDGMNVARHVIPVRGHDDDGAVVVELRRSSTRRGVR